MANLILITLAFAVGTFVVFCAQSVGFGRLEKVGIVVLIPAVAIVSFLCLVVFGRGYPFAGITTLEEYRNYASSIDPKIVILSISFWAGSVGASSIVVGSLITTWRNRRSIFPFLFHRRPEDGP